MKTFVPAAMLAAIAVLAISGCSFEHGPRQQPSPTSSVPTISAPADS